MTSIVIPVFNQLHYTQGCLESLRKTVPPGTSIIVVNNGSTDGTREFLAAQQDIQVIDNGENRGCAVAWNQGVNAFAADWTVILNNDVLLAPGWLDGMICFAGQANCQVVSPGIREGELNYPFEEYAREFTARMADAARFGVADGICFMVQRDVFERIGGFDENFRIGVFEDADFFLRARRAGFRLGITGRAFIHHFGSMTQKSLRVDRKVRPYEAENRAYFRQKWKLGPVRRFWMRWSGKTAAALARRREVRAHGHSLNEKWIDGKLEHH